MKITLEIDDERFFDYTEEDMKEKKNTIIKPFIFLTKKYSK